MLFLKTEDLPIEKKRFHLYFQGYYQLLFRHQLQGANKRDIDKFNPASSTNIRFLISILSNQRR